MLIIDADPQCNATSYLLPERMLLKIYEDEQEALLELKQLRESDDGYVYYMDPCTIIPRKTLHSKSEL